MKTALIIAYECRPYNRHGSTIGAQRPYQFAKYLPLFGWRAIVICRDFKMEGLAGQDWIRNTELNISQKIETWNGTNSLIIPLPSLDYADKIDRVWRNTYHSNNRDGNYNAYSGLKNVLIRKITTLLKLFRGDHSQNWQAISKIASNIIINKIRIDCVISEHSPDASVYTGKYIKEEYNLPWLLDLRDPYDRNLGKLQRLLLNILHINRFHSIDYVVNVNDYWTQIESKRFKCKGSTIYNGYDDDEFNFRVENDDKLLTIGYFGNFVYKGSDITPFIKALNLIEKNKIKFIYRGHDNNILESYMKNNGINNQMLDIGRFVERKEVLKLMNRCDILLLLSLKDIHDFYLKKGLHPGKTFEYLATNKPILVIPGDNGLLDELIQQTKSGKIASSKKQISILLRQAIREKENNEAIWNIKADRKEIYKYSRKRQTEKLANILDELVAN